MKTTLCLVLLLCGCLRSPAAINSDLHDLLSLAQHASALRKQQRCAQAAQGPQASAPATPSCEALSDCLHLLSDAGHAGRDAISYIAGGNALPSTAAAASSNAAAASIDAASSLPGDVVSSVVAAAKEHKSEAEVIGTFTGKRDVANKQCAVAGVPR